MMSSQVSFEKVGECLYRNPSSIIYYAVTKVRDKQINPRGGVKVLLELIFAPEHRIRGRRKR